MDILIWILNKPILIIPLIIGVIVAIWELGKESKHMGKFSENFPILLKKKLFNWTPILVTLILVAFASTIIALWFYYYELRPVFKKTETIKKARYCLQKIYNRPNELNMEWAEGKEWKYVSGTDGNWGWIYPDQGSLRNDAKDYKAIECLKNMGITPDMIP